MESAPRLALGARLIARLPCYLEVPTCARVGLAESVYGIYDGVSNERGWKMATTTAASPRVFKIGDCVQSNRHGGIGTVRKIVDHRPTGEPLLCITAGQCGWYALSSEATLVDPAKPV